jgi:predicted membrane protein
MSQDSNRSRMVIGLIIIAAGAMLLFRNLNFFPPYFNFLFSWKMILVIVGLIVFMNSSNKTSGIILIAVGGIFLIPDILGVPYFNTWRVVLPVLLIVVGLLILLRRNFDTRSYDAGNSKYDMDYIDEVAIFGGIEKNINTSSFKGGKITAIFGGGEINLLNSDLAEGKNSIDMLAVFGGVTLYVPDDWSVKVDIVPIFGGFSDTRSHSRLIVKDASRELIIRGMVIFGGGEIKTL